MSEQQTLANYGNPTSKLNATNGERYKNPDWLREQYVEEHRPALDIADELGINIQTVLNWLEKHGTETRSRGESRLPPSALEKLCDRNWLHEKYVEQRKSTPDIADELGVSETAVKNWLDKHSIDTRSTSEAMSAAVLPAEAFEKLRNEDWLQEQYVEQRRSTADIADELGVSTSSVSWWLDCYGIETRSLSESIPEARLPDNALEKLRKEEWLREQYVEQQRSTPDIADELSVSEGAVRNWLDKHSIEIRSNSEAQLLVKSHYETKVDQETRLGDEDWLREQYIEQRRSAADIAEEINVGETTVQRWLERYNIQTRSSSETQLSTDAAAKLKDDGWLREEYIENHRSAHNIANELGVGVGTIHRWLAKYDIEKLSLADATAEGKLPAGVVEKLSDEEWLREHYVEKRWSATKIANELNVSTSPVFTWLEKHGVELRSRSEALLPRNAVRKLHDGDWLREQYIDQERLAGDIADELRVSGGTVVRWLEQHDIEIRSGLQDPDHLDHIVRSTWELEVANRLHRNDIEYEYEGLEINWVDDKIYTPDFVTEEYVIEVKGNLYGMSEEEKARATMKELDDREYVVVGTELPCDIHIPWEERDSLEELFSSQ